MAHEFAGSLQQVSGIRQRCATKESHVYMRPKYIDVAKGCVAQACDRAAIVHELPDFVSAFSQHLKPPMRNIPQFTPMLFHPRVDGGIALDSAIQSEQIRSHRDHFFLFRHEKNSSLLLTERLSNGESCALIAGRSPR